MYMNHFGLKEFPFSLTSDPRFMYLSDDHARVAASIEYAMNVQDSFVVFTGEIGTGKTTLINHAMMKNKTGSRVARIQATSMTANEFLQSVLIEFGYKPYELSKVQMLQALKQFLISNFRNGKKVFLIIDEAHNLSDEMLEDIRYLSDMEMGSQKLLGVILVGQPELNTFIDQPGKEHIQQRIRLRFHIKPLSGEQVNEYIRHRLSVAGTTQLDIFEPDCIAMIQQYTGGRLRLINTLCDYALMHCYVEKLTQVNTWVLQQAANELQWEPYEKRFAHDSDVTRILINKPEAETSRLVMRFQSNIVAEYELDKECFSIGRMDDNDIALDDHKASRHHAQILCHADAVYLHDLNSTNGTFTRGGRVNVHQLQNGEEFVIGEYHFTFLQSAQMPVVEELETEKDTTRRMNVDNPDQTRVRYPRQVMQLVHSQDHDTH